MLSRSISLNDLGSGVKEMRARKYAAGVEVIPFGAAILARASVYGYGICDTRPVLKLQVWQQQRRFPSASNPADPSHSPKLPPRTTPPRHPRWPAT